jgi:predicted nucleotidyltransferase component of viral defense system
MKNVGESVLAHLRQLSKRTGMDPQSYIRLYAQQRLLYRISVSDVAPLFVLKGGLMLAVYNNGALFRASEDIDFNGYMEGGAAEIEEAIRKAVGTPVPDDGVRFNLDGMKAIKEHVGRIMGSKIKISASVHTAVVPIRIDVGFDNVITPEALPVEIPTLLPDLVPCPVIAGYPLETIIAEKLHAVHQFGFDNTRHKDLYDLWRIQGGYSLDGPVVAMAVSRTFEHQGSLISPGLPGLSDAYARDNALAWTAFLRKNQLVEPTPFTEVMARLRDFADPVMDAANGRILLGNWRPDIGWEQFAPALAF